MDDLKSQHFIQDLKRLKPNVIHLNTLWETYSRLELQSFSSEDPYSTTALQSLLPQKKEQAKVVLQSLDQLLELL